MHQNMVNNLAEAMKALDGKKSFFCPLLPFVAPSPSCCCCLLAFSLLVPVHTTVEVPVLGAMMKQVCTVVAEALPEARVAGATV